MKHRIIVTEMFYLSMSWCDGIGSIRGGRKVPNPSATGSPFLNDVLGEATNDINVLEKCKNILSN